jgi:hypothetical protein
MLLFQFKCAYGGNMIIIKPRFLKRRLGRQFLEAILGPPLHIVYLRILTDCVWGPIYTIESIYRILAAQCNKIIDSNMPRKGDLITNSVSVQLKMTYE